MWSRKPRPVSTSAMALAVEHELDADLGLAGAPLDPGGARAARRRSRHDLRDAETTMSVPPCSLMLRIRPGRSARGTAAFTAKPASWCRGAIVGSRMQGRIATTASSRSVGTLTSSMTRLRASSTERTSTTKCSIRARFAGLVQRARAGVEPGRGAHQLVEDQEAVRLERGAGGRVVDDAVGVLGREHLGGAVGADDPAVELRAASSQAPVIRSYSVATTKPGTAGRRRSRKSGAAAATIRTGSRAGVDQLDQLGTLLHHPVGTGEAQVARAQMQHLDDVLRLEDLGLEAVEREGRPVAAPVEGQPDAGIGQQAHDAVLHPALGQGQMDDGVARGVGRGQGGSEPRRGSGPAALAQSGRIL